LGFVLELRFRAIRLDFSERYWRDSPKEGLGSVSSGYKHAAFASLRGREADECVRPYTNWPIGNGDYAVAAVLRDWKHSRQKTGRP
jgi:hypothetical protein